MNVETLNVATATEIMRSAGISMTADTLRAGLKQIIAKQDKDTARCVL